MPQFAGAGPTTLVGELPRTGRTGDPLRTGADKSTALGSKVVVLWCCGVQAAEDEPPSDTGEPPSAGTGSETRRCRTGVAESETLLPGVALQGVPAHGSWVNEAELTGVGATGDWAPVTT